MVSKKIEILKSSVIKKFSFFDESILFKYINHKHNFPKHIHEDTYMIGTCIEGSSVFTIEKETYIVEEDKICIIPTKVVHFCTSDKKNKNWKFLNFHVKENLLHEIANNICADNTSFSFEKYFIKDIELSNYLKNIIYKTLNNEAIDEESTLNLLTMLIENYAIFDKKIKDVKIQKFEPLFEYLKKDNYCLKHLDFYKMAQIMNMNPYYFHRTFSKTIGLTPQTFINALRISKATKLLDKYDSLAEIALKSGFYDQAYFTKQFKKHYGITPTNFKNIS